MFNERGFALNTSVSDLAHLLTVEFFPFLIVKIFIKERDRAWICEIDKGIANITFVLEVDGQIKKVIGSFVFAVNGCKEHFLIVFVWDIFDHESSAQILSTAHFV
jgi:hypothetical protein